MSDRETLSEAKTSLLQQLFNRAKPKARYISETHVEQQTSSIAKEIINGDIQVRKTKGNFSANNEKSSYEDMLRRRYMEQIERQKQALEHKLGYIENSLTSFEKYEYLRKKSNPQEESLSISRQNNEQWRREFREEMKKIQQKKKELAEKSREKEMQAQELRAKIKDQEKAKQKAEIQQSIRKIKSRSQQREVIAKQEKEKLKEILSKRELFQKMEEGFKEKQEDVLEQRKKKLAEIRQLKHPISLQQIIEHEQRVLETLKQKESVREREKRMNQSRARSYRPSYESVFYKQIASPQVENQQNPKQKLQKMRQFSEQVKTNFVPQIDQNKRRQMEDKVERELKERAERQQKERQLAQKPKLKGLEYLELVKKMPKKRDSPPPTAPKSERIQYKNYLGNLSVDMGKSKPWKTILSRGEHKVETALMLQYQSEKLQQKLKRKQEYTRLMKQKDDGSIDQEYYDMVKAKLDLLAKD